MAKPERAGVLSHSMKTYVGTEVCVAGEYAIKTDLYLSVIWKLEVEDGAQSSVACLKIYSD